MANPHNPYPSAQEMGTLVPLAGVNNIKTTYTAAATITSIDPVARAIGASGATGFEVALAVAPKPGQALRYFIASDHTAGTHKLVPSTATCNIIERDLSTALSTSIDFGTTAVPGTYVDLEYYDVDTWIVRRYGTGFGPAAALPTGVTES